MRSKQETADTYPLRLTEASDLEWYLEKLLVLRVHKPISLLCQLISNHPRFSRSHGPGGLHDHLQELTGQLAEV